MKVSHRHGTKVNKTWKCKNYFPSSYYSWNAAVWNAVSLLEDISKFITYTLAAISLAHLHVLGPKWVETEFQDKVPRNSIKGVVMYRYVKNTNYSLAGKKLAKYYLLHTANVYEHSRGSSALQEWIQWLDYVPKIWGQNLFFTQHFKKSILFFPQIIMDNWQ